MKHSTNKMGSTCIFFVKLEFPKRLFLWIADAGVELKRALLGWENVVINSSLHCVYTYICTAYHCTEYPPIHCVSWHCAKLQLGVYFAHPHTTIPPWPNDIICEGFHMKAESCRSTLLNNRWSIEQSPPTNIIYQTNDTIYEVYIPYFWRWQVAQ